VSIFLFVETVIEKVYIITIEQSILERLLNNIFNKILFFKT